MRWHLLFFLLLPLLLRANSDAIFSEREDLALCHHVNVISGNLNLYFQDAIVEGASPLSITRTYSSAGAFERIYNRDFTLSEFYDKWFIQGGWTLIPHMHLLLEESEEVEKTTLYLAEKNGTLIKYVFDHSENERYSKNYAHIFKPEISSGQYSGILNARTNPNNNWIRYFPFKKSATLYLPDGGSRHYGRALNIKPNIDNLFRLSLETEIAPNQHHTTYHHSDNKFTIAVQNPSQTKTFSSALFKMLKSKRKKDFHIQVSTSDTKDLHYRSITFKDRHYLSNVQSNYRPLEESGYIPSRKGLGARMETLILDGKLQFKVHYYEPPNKKKELKWAQEPDRKGLFADKVKIIEGPMEKNGELVPLASFAYSSSYTDVRDGENILTRYHHDGNKLLEIHYFDHRDQLDSLLKFTWDGPWLKGKTFFKNAEEALFSKTFQYDALGNVTEEILWGNLTGEAGETFSMEANGSLKGAECYRKRFSYLPNFNVPILEEEEDGPTYKYFYKPNTNLLTAQLLSENGQILVRQFFFYNEDNLLIKEITDDGGSEDPDDLSEISERHIKHYTLDAALGLITSCRESCLMSSGKEQILKQTDYTYSAQRRVIAESIYDAEGTHRYTLYTDYDSQGRITAKTTPSGQRNTYLYDSQGHLLESKEVGSPKKIYSYHPSGNPLSCQEIGSAGDSRTSFTTYDAKGRLLAQTNAQGHTTLQTYDPFGRCLSTQFPLVKDPEGMVYHPTIYFSYDVQGNLASTTSPRDETTHTVYNTLKKPIQITHPDGSISRHVYNKNGTLASTLYPDGTEARYTYDLFQRMTLKQIYSSEKLLLSEELWEYNAFHLLSHTDEKGLTTTFEYDEAGRKIAESSEDRTQAFSYDALGFLEIRTDGNLTQVQIHDEAGRIVEQWTQDATDKIENLMQFFYDEENRKIKATRITSQGIATDFFSYDSQGRLCRHENPIGEISQFIANDYYLNDLGQQVLQKTTIDPLGNQKVETFDVLDRLSSMERRDSKGRSVSFEELSYDSSGNCAKRLTSIFEGNKRVNTISTLWEYDCHGHVVKEIESGKKITAYDYDLRGNLVTKKLPSGTTLHYSYDGLGRMTQIFSSDKTIHYDYFYKLGPEPVAIIDQIQHLALKRSYNSFGQVLEEKGPSGLSYSWNYDSYGRCIEFTLPDNSSIAYDYLGGHLQTVKRHSSQGALLYDHRYTEFDPNGHVQNEELILNLGTIQTQHDLLERPSCQITPHLQHSIAYGPSGLVTATQNSLLGSKTYQYDALNQLSQEAEQHYAFNSLGNPINAVVDDCNQLIATEDTVLIYDRNGNPKQKRLPKDALYYTYDALGRLLSIKGNEKEITYTYDPLSRLLSKELKKRGRIEKTLYLHNKETEIGTITEERKILQLKVLGLGVKGDIGGAIALELDGKIFAPLHDFGGNIIAILSTRGAIAENYPTDAFGKEKLNFKPLNPWRFSSKRNEEGLIYFGKRFYDPSLGRWLTPDPAGLSEGPNLYLYVLNSPLNRLDLFGLHSDPLYPWTHEKDIRIDAPIYDLKNTSNAKDVLVCKGSIGDVEVDWVIACGNWHKLQFSPEELNRGVVNIVDHFHEIMPKEGMIIGLITGQNGIQTSLSEFQSMSKSIVDKVPESTLYVGLHNRSTGLLGDLCRVMKERNGKETPTVARTRQFMEAIVGELHNINPSLLWMHISHSEGSLIAHTAIEKMNPDIKAELKEHFISYSYGGAHPIAKSVAYAATNVYSKRDYVAKRFATPFLKDPDYDIKIVKCLSKFSEMDFFFIDHGFMLTTSQISLRSEINNNRKEIGFYNDQSR